MDVFEIKHCLESMTILVDTREQDTKRARERYARFGCPYTRCKLEYGDYGYNFQLPSGEWYFNPDSEKINPPAVVERKMNLDELASCFTRDRKRFEAEFQRAKEHDARIYLVVENANWENLMNGQYRSQIHPNAFIASVFAWTVRYGLQLIFCKQETAGRIIHEILFRELKERLERGEEPCRAVRAG